MHSTKSNIKTSFKIEQLLAVVGAVICLIICYRVWQFLRLEYSPGNQPASIWPLPALYLVELALLSVISVISVFNDRQIWNAVIWAVVGIFLAFVLLGRLSIGSFFLPSTLLFAIAAIIITKRQGRSVMIYLGLSVLTALGQAALMLTAVALHT